MRWKILIEEFGLKIVYIKGDDNTIADALSRLDIRGESPSYKKTQQQLCFAMRLFTSIKRSEESHLDQNEGESDDSPFPLDLEVVAREQKKDKVLVAKSKRDGQKIKKEVVQDVELITHEGKVYIPPRLRDDVLN